MLNLPQTHISIPQHILDATQLTPTDLKRELAITLYAQHHLSIGKARELAELSLPDFRQLLSTRKIPVHYDENDFNTDVKTLNEIL